MRFEPTEIGGVVRIESDPAGDARGFFARVHCSREFAGHGIDLAPAQTSLSSNRRRGTVRGLHYQVPPFAEAKLVCCVAGAAFDAVVDLRRASPTFGRALWLTLEAGRANMIYVPVGCAHGYQTLADDTTLLYMISAPYHAAAARGVRWDDPALAIPWPERANVFLSDRDKKLPLLAQLEADF
jgi:dTDP-4-dehydrorhamnose 3,5-epimerase